MSLLQVCATPGCGTRTLGRFCVDHETLPSRRPRERGSWRSEATVTAHIASPALVAASQHQAAMQATYARQLSA